MRIRRIRCKKCSESKKFFEYLVDGSRTWITEDQLRISLNPKLLAELRGDKLRHAEGGRKHEAGLSTGAMRRYPYI